jgi:ABC-type multidrug transport system fused ATPase/permease subunit
MAVSEAFGAIKEIKVKGLEQTHIKNFYNSAKTLARVQASSQVVALLPRYILEAIAFGGILLMILYMMKQTGSFINALPILSLYVFAGYRLMPALQQIYVSFTQLTYVGPAIDRLYDDLNKLKPLNINSKVDSFIYNKKISLKNIYYNYPNSKRMALKNIDLSIPVKSTVGLVGATGGGKTTMVDIILGLLDPSKGTLEVDEQIISKKNVRSWQSTIGYVPQHIYLSDDTIAANIAFGVDSKEIDQNAIEFASKTANLHDFVSQELPQKYQTIVGERGARLSGGQRQRIGIARALYHSPQTLILDEATSALDNQTEQVIMKAINKLSKEITIIIIAHRLSTLKKCDQIFLLEKGEIKKAGTFEEVINTYEKFNIKSN